MEAQAVDQLVQGYTAAWSEPDAAKRHMLLEQVWEADGEYTDRMLNPLTAVAWKPPSGSS